MIVTKRPHPILENSVEVTINWESNDSSQSTIVLFAGAYCYQMASDYENYLNLIKGKMENEKASAPSNTATS